MENKKLDIIRKLLAQAEGAGTPEEAETFAAKAEELMVRYSIDAAQVAAGQPRASDPIDVRQVTLEGYPIPKAQLIAAVARNLNCDVVLRHTYDRGVKVALVYGHSSDLEAFDVLATSLLLQAVTGATQAHKRTPWVNGRTFRHNFLLGFAGRVYDRMAKTTEEVVATSTGTALMLRDRKAVVTDYMKEQHDKLGKSSTKVTHRGSYMAGDEAGKRATLHTSSEVGHGARQQIGG